MEYLAIYAALFLGIGFYEYIKRRDFAQFVVAGRRFGPGTVGVSIVASCVGGSATIGMAGLAFQVGTPAFWWLGSGAVGLIVLTVLLASKVRKANVFTLPDMAQKFISPGARRLSAIIIIPAWTAILAAQYIAAAKIASSLDGVSYEFALIACAAVITAYTMLGGQNSIVKSDAVQYALVVGGLGLALIFAAQASPVTMSSVPVQFVNDDFSLSTWTYFMIIVGGSYVVCPMLFGRLFSARDHRAARRGALFSVIGLVVSALMIVGIGLYARGLAPAGADADSILTAVVPSIMPGWAAGVLLFALLSAIISSADSCLITAATVLEHDIFQGQSVKRCRLTMLGLGLAALFVAQSGSGILTLLLAANDIYVCGVVMPLFVAIMAWGKRSLEPRLMLAAMALGGLCGIAAALTGAKAWSYAGVGISLALSALALVRAKAVATQSVRSTFHS